METNLFNNFYLEFIQLVSNHEYTSKMLIQEFKYKLTPRLQDCLDSKAELYNSILALVKHCLSIYKQI